MHTRIVLSAQAAAKASPQPAGLQATASTEAAPVCSEIRLVAAVSDLQIMQGSVLSSGIHPKEQSEHDPSGTYLHGTLTLHGLMNVTV